LRPFLGGSSGLRAESVWDWDVEKARAGTRIGLMNWRLVIFFVSDGVVVVIETRGMLGLDAGDVGFVMKLAARRVDTGPRLISASSRAFGRANALARLHVRVQIRRVLSSESHLRKCKAKRSPRSWD